MEMKKRSMDLNIESLAGVSPVKIKELGSMLKVQSATDIGC